MSGGSATSSRTSSATNSPMITARNSPKRAPKLVELSGVGAGRGDGTSSAKGSRDSADVTDDTTIKIDNVAIEGGETTTTSTPTSSGATSGTTYSSSTNVPSKAPEGTVNTVIKAEVTANVTNTALGAATKECKVDNNVSSSTNELDTALASKEVDTSQESYTTTSDITHHAESDSATSLRGIVGGHDTSDMTEFLLDSDHNISNDLTDDTDLHEKTDHVAKQKRFAMSPVKYNLRLKEPSDISGKSSFILMKPIASTASRGGSPAKSSPLGSTSTTTTGGSTTPRRTISSKLASDGSGSPKRAGSRELVGSPSKSVMEPSHSSSKRSSSKGSKDSAGSTVVAVELNDIYPSRFTSLHRKNSSSSDYTEGSIEQIEIEMTGG